MKAIPFKRAGRLLLLPLIIISAFLISYNRLLDNYELETLDLRFSVRPKITTLDKVVLIEIGEDSIEKLGRFPFDRSYHALLIKALDSAGAKGIVFDIFFSEPQASDKELETAVREAGNVYLPFVFDIDAGVKSNLTYARGYTAKTIPDLSAAAKGEGHINISPDRDGKFRRVPLYIRYGDLLYPYISFLTACDYLAIPKDEIEFLPRRHITCSPNLKIPLDDNSNMIINFSGRWGFSYKHYSYVDILQSYLATASGQKPILDLGLFKDKICIVGLTAAGTVDLHPNPFEPLYPGMGIHAEVFNSILTKRFITRSSKGINLILLMALSLLTSLVTLKTKPTKGFSALVMTILIFTAIGISLFDFFGIWIDLFVPIMVMVYIYLFLTLYKYIIEWRKRLVFESELDIAKRIQESFLPKRLPAIRGIEMSVSMLMARKVGGDLYDFVEFSPERLGVMIGDVSGKGIPASLFMAMVTGKFKFFANAKREPKDVLSSLNSTLVAESSSNLFVTMLYVIFDMEENTLEFANGGHLPLIYLSEDADEAEFLDTSEGTPLGLMEGLYSDRKMDFKKDGIFVFYTDGVTEAMNSRLEMYGKDRLAKVIESARDLSPKAILHTIVKDVQKFEPKAKQHDDMTLIVMKIGGVDIR